MSIDSPGTLLAGVLAALLCTIALAHFWDSRRALGRIALVLPIVVALAATSALQVNQLTATYPSWSTLLGSPAKEPPLSVGIPAAGRPRPGGGRLLTVTVPGRASGLNLTMGVYLPAEYDRPEAAGRRYPVIEALHGYPGSPATWIRRLEVIRYLDREIDSGRMAPTVVLFPYQTPRRLLDTECTNMVGGPQTETFVTTDVFTYATTNLRVRPERGAWGLIGYSAGGYCAMNLALRHPDRYAAAASLSGDTDPAITVGDGSEHTTNNVAWRLAHLPQPRISLYVTWATDDRESRSGSEAVVRLAHSPLSLTAVNFAHGGHSHTLWRRMEGPAFDWLSARLSRTTCTPHVPPLS